MVPAARGEDWPKDRFIWRRNSDCRSSRWALATTVRGGWAPGIITPCPGHSAALGAVISPAIHVPSDLDRAGMEHYRLQVELLMNRLTLEAEAWAESGTRKIDEVPLRREPIWRRPHPPSIHRTHLVRPHFALPAAPSSREFTHASRKRPIARRLTSAMSGCGSLPLVVPG